MARRTRRRTFGDNWGQSGWPVKQVSCCHRCPAEDAEASFQVGRTTITHQCERSPEDWVRVAEETPVPLDKARPVYKFEHRPSKGICSRQHGLFRLNSKDGGRE